jgi:hypothetical protein
MFSPVWRLPTAAALVGGLLYLLLLGLVADQSVNLVDTSPGSQTPQLLQAALGAEGAIGALALAVLGIAIQIRASSFGADLAIRLHSWSGLAALAVGLVVSIVLTALVLGNWNTWGDDGSHAAVVLMLSFGIMALFTIAVVRFVANSSNSRGILDPVADLALSHRLEDDLRIFGWNSNSSYRFPIAVSFLSQALIGAWRQNDLELFTDIVDRWVWNLEQQDFQGRMQPPHTPSLLNDRQGQLEWKKNRVMSWEDADAYDGLDIALSRSVRSIYSAIQKDTNYVYKLAGLARLVFPPFGPDRKGNFEIARWGWEQQSIPGFRVIDELANFFIRNEDWNALTWLLEDVWHEKAILAISWAEANTEESIKNGDYPRLRVSKELADWVARCRDLAGLNNAQELRDASTRVLVNLAAEAESLASLREILSVLQSTETFADHTFAWSMRDMTRIAGKQHVPMNQLLLLLKRHNETLLGPNAPQYFMIHDYVPLFAALTKKLSNSDRPAERLTEDDLADIIWPPIQTAMEHNSGEEGQFAVFASMQLRQSLRELVQELPTGVTATLRGRLDQWVREDGPRRSAFDHIFDSLETPSGPQSGTPK